MSNVWIVAARRTAVAPVDSLFRHVEPVDLAAVVIKTLLESTTIPGGARVEVILGNALYGGGNPARVAALAAGLPVTTPAFTIDTQCCSGLDAIGFGAARILSGGADVVIAGGLESFSRAPLRFRKPPGKNGQPKYYARPPFTPWADRDPDLIVSAAALASTLNISRFSQEAFAIESHRKAVAGGDISSEIVCIDGVRADRFARHLTPLLCARLPAIAGEAPHELTAATIAVQADAAAAVVLVNDSLARILRGAGKPIRYAGLVARGFDPVRPALAPIHAARELLALCACEARDLSVIEIMEAFAVQAQAFNLALDLEPARVNRGGGALARGHPIGASGAILAVRLFHELQREESGAMGLAAIAAAGGLGSAMLLERRDV